MTRCITNFGLLFLSFICSANLQADVYLNLTNWDNYNLGALNGQHGWTTLSGIENEIQVVGESERYVYMNSRSMNEDIMLDLPVPVGNNSLFFATSFSLLSISAGGSDYFMSFHGLVNQGGSLYALAGRLFATQYDDGYILGITSHSNSTNHHTEKLNFGEIHTVIMEYDLSTGVTTLWLDPTSIDSDPILVSEDHYMNYQMESIVFRNNTGNIELNIYNAVIGNDFKEALYHIPEPSSYALISGMANLGLIAALRRRR